jgi:3-dehydroquinate dehydratase-1
MICVSLAEAGYDSLVNALEKIEFAEVRIDLIGSISSEEICKIFSMDKKMIATCRPQKFTEMERRNLLISAIKSGARYVDIEIESPEQYRRDIISVARDYKCEVIVSYHNYFSTPDRDELFNVVSRCFNIGADIAKVVCKANKQDEFARLLSLYEMDKKIISFGMGKEAKFTRVVAPFLGAPFTYASFRKGKETAEGQINYINLQKAIEILQNV